ncbi:hypothetical protein EV1_023812 [Malus domestica]
MQFLALYLYASYFLFISCFLQIYYPAKAQKIDQFSSGNTTGNYTSGSVYEQNLNITLTFLVANAFQTGFYVTSMGQINDVVYGLVQCRVLPEAGFGWLHKLLVRPAFLLYLDSFPRGNL